MPTMRITSALVVAAITANAVAGLPDPVRRTVEVLDLASDVFDGDGVSSRGAYLEVIERPGAPWMRLRIGEHDLGQESYLTIMSLSDGRMQRQTAATLREWDNWTAFFNGDAVELELYVAPNDKGVFVEIESAVYGQAAFIEEPPPPSAVASICGAFDNRIASDDSRVGRLFFGGCTAWLISNGGVLTAGHCTNDDTGAIGGVVEFNVPMSDADGESNRADPDDQYPVIAGSVAFQDNGIGDDWALFEVGANSNTGLRAHIAQGFFRLTDSAPAIDSTLRVTGYGLDNLPAGVGGGTPHCCDASNDDVCEYDCNSSSLTQQTSTGRLDDIEVFAIEHEADTLPANSGSPIIWEANGLAIGVHTAGGCDDFFSGYNNFGTHFSHPFMTAWINNLRGDDAVYVDVARNITFPTGTVFRPWETVAQAVAAVSDGGVVSIVEGSYPASAGNTFTAGSGNKAMTLEAPVGVVTIGN